MSFFSEVEGLLKKVFGNTSWQRTATTAITVLSPLLETAVEETAGEKDAVEVADIVKQAQSDLSLVSDTIAKCESVPSASDVAKIEQALAGVNSNLSQILTAGHITNATTASKITVLVGEISGEVTAILSVLPKAA